MKYAEEASVRLTGSAFVDMAERSSRAKEWASVLCPGKQWAFCVPVLMQSQECRAVVL
ncbi:hypothetical protein GCM10010317_041210 [Streptomyces mirabilis]|nr:hypothetical protein GCM10010317_041210 [Streptomyces mirabilis]